jgi:ABC-2 type transport system ATP-binding protein
MIEVVGLHRWFGSVHAVRGVDFEIPAGQVVGLLGPNGAGKTTTLRMLTGIIRPQLGSISIADVDAIANPVKARRGFGYLPESAPSYPEMSVSGFLRYRSQILGVHRGSRKSQIAKAVEECQLGSVASRRIGQLSKGFRQRVALASALLHDPKVLILDEPTNGLDPTQIREARSLIGDLAQNRTVLVSSHILPEIERTCERVIIIGTGKVLADGTPEELCEQNTEGGCIAECKGHGAKISSTLANAFPDSTVETTPLEGGWWRIEIQSPGTGDSCELVGAALSSAKIQIRQLRPAVAGLEDVFVRVLDASAGAEA